MSNSEKGFLYKSCLPLCVSSCILSVLSLIFGVITLTQKDLAEIWLKNVTNLFSLSAIVTSFFGILFNLIIFIRIKAQDSDFSKKHLTQLIFSVLGLISSIVFTTLINK